MNEASEATEMQPFTKQLLEAVAAAMGIDKGDESLFLGFQDGSRRDEGNSPMELGRFDEGLRYELERLVANAC